MRLPSENKSEFDSAIDSNDQLKLSKSQGILESIIYNDPVFQHLNFTNPSDLDNETVDHINKVTMRAQEKVFLSLNKPIEKPNVSLSIGKHTPVVTVNQEFTNKESSISDLSRMRAIQDSLSLDSNMSQIVDGTHDFNFKNVPRTNFRFAQEGPESEKVECDWTKMLPDWTDNLLPDETCYSKKYYTTKDPNDYYGFLIWKIGDYS